MTMKLQDKKRISYSVTELCEATGLSRPLFYKLIKNGNGPDEMYRVGRRVLIPVDAAQRWLDSFRVTTG